jgi:hypothetical protein
VKFKNGVQNLSYFLPFFEEVAAICVKISELAEKIAHKVLQFVEHICHFSLQ